jgi:hypothetical protein
MRLQEVTGNGEICPPNRTDKASLPMRRDPFQKMEWARQMENRMPFSSPVSKVSATRHMPIFGP